MQVKTVKKNNNNKEPNTFQYSWTARCLMLEYFHCRFWEFVLHRIYARIFWLKNPNGDEWLLWHKMEVKHFQVNLNIFYRIQKPNRNITLINFKTKIYTCGKLKFQLLPCVLYDQENWKFWNSCIHFREMIFLTNLSNIAFEYIWICKYNHLTSKRMK